MNRRTRSRRGAVVLLASFGATAGCGLDVIATGPDVAIAASDDARANAESGTDGGAPDESSVVYLPPVDGGTGSPTGLPGFCLGQTAHVACWDFDDALPGGDAGFPEVTPAGGSFDVALEGTNHVLRLVLPTGTSSRSSFVRYPVTNFGQLRAHYAVEMKLGVRQSTLEYDVLGALWATTPSKFFVLGVASYQNTFLDMVAPDKSTVRLTAPAGPLWHTAKITIDGPSSAMHAQVVVDGVVTVDDETIDTGTQTQTGIDLRLGAYFTAATPGGLTVVFDDIVVRAP